MALRPDTVPKSPFETKIRVRHYESLETALEQALLNGYCRMPRSKVKRRHGRLAPEMFSLGDAGGLYICGASIRSMYGVGIWDVPLRSLGSGTDSAYQERFI